MGARTPDNESDAGVLLPADNELGIIGGWGFNLPSSKLIAAFEEAGENVRKTASIATTAELEAIGTTFQFIDRIEDYDGGIRVKFSPRSDETSTTDTGALNYSTNFKVFRYADYY